MVIVNYYRREYQLKRFSIKTVGADVNHSKYNLFLCLLTNQCLHCYNTTDIKITLRVTVRKNQVS